MNAVRTSFAGLVPIVEATGEVLFDVMKSKLRQYDLKMQDCIGFGCDGASAMVGIHNSVWSRLRKESPNCILMKCICHSLALCVQHAFDCLPSNLGYMLSEIPKWFRKSAIRRDAYKQLFSVMNSSEENRVGIPLPFTKMSATRWLVRGKVITNTLLNWEELKAYFECAQVDGCSDARYKARMITEMLRDNINYLYFAFLSPVVSEFERLNATFQAVTADPDFLLKELTMLYETLRSRLYDVRGNPKTVAQIDFGAHFLTEAQRLICQNNTADFSQMVSQMKVRCQTFLLELLSQVEKRIPPDQTVFQSLSALQPDKVLSQTARLPFLSLPFQHLIIDVNKTEEQYRKLIHVPWADHTLFDGTIPSSPVAFWSGVLRYTNAAKEEPFRELAEYCLACLSVPVSNAVAERTFSVVSNVKTKVRNRISIRMLDAIVRIRTHFSSDQCCREFTVDGLYDATGRQSKNRG
jgi:hypothetical protein